MKSFLAIILFALGLCYFTHAQAPNGKTIVDDKNKLYTTYSQGFYGNSNAMNCSGISSRDLISNLLTSDLLIGGGDNTLTIKRDEVDMLIQRLPGGGPSEILDGAATCNDPVGIQLSNNKFKNSLLAQTIALGLNLRADKQLGKIKLEDTKFKTWESKSCSEADAVKKGKASSFFISKPVLDYLGYNNTVDDLYALANAALAGDKIKPLELWQVTSAVAVINFGFNNGRILKGFYGPKNDSKVSFSDQELFAMEVYPNPMTTHGTIDFTTLEAGQTTIELFNMMGEKVDVFMDERVEKFTPVKLDIETEDYKKGMYLLYIRNGSNVTKVKITIVV